VARTLSDILRRFRPAVAPGPAGPAGVPADRVAEAEAELAVVFEALAPTVQEAQQLRGQAKSEADHRRHAAVEEAEHLIADARGHLDAVRADAAASQLATVDETRGRLEREAHDSAGALTTRAETRLPGVVARVVGEIRAAAGLPRSPAVDAPKAKSA
jgi:hypothetical protein